MVVVDKIGFKIAWTLFRHQTKDVFCIDSPSRSYYFFQKMLLFAGISVREDVFKLAELESETDSSLYLKSLQLSSKLAIDLASHMIRSTNLSDVNEYFERNTILLQLSKGYQPVLFEMCLKIVIAQHRYGDDDEIFLEKPNVIPKGYIFKSLVANNISLYSSPGDFFEFYISVFRKYISTVIKKTYLARASVQLRSKVFKIYDPRYTVLCLKEDSVVMDARLRSQQFWLEGSASVEQFVLDVSSRGLSTHSAEKIGNSTVLPFGYLGVALNRYGNDYRLTEVKEKKEQVKKAITLRSSVAQQYALRAISSLL